MPVDTKLQAYLDNLPRWQQVDDCVMEMVKERGTTYLPKPNPSDESDDNTIRYSQYKRRAVFVNVVKRTHDGMIGAVYRNAPESEIPAQLEYLTDDADGAGMGLTQFSKRLLSHTMQAGRAGVLVDYPPAPDDLTAEQARGLEATLVEYRAKQIINWREDAGKLVMVVLHETYETTDDGFEYEVHDQYRELRIEDGAYVQRLWREGMVVAEYEPRKSDGSRWDVIPFTFVGTVNNDTCIDPSLLYALSELNIAHYRNSADLEENCYIHGQLTLGVVSDMAPEQFQQANPSGIQVGARRGHFLGAEGNFVSVQAQPNQLADALMARKEQQMLSIGARLIQQSGGNETAEAVRARSGADSANLSSLAHNVSDAITQALMWAAEFMGANPDDVAFALNQQFYPESMDAQAIAALIQLYDRGRIGSIDLHRKLQATGIISEDRTVEEVEQESSERSPMTGISFPSFNEQP